MGNNSSKYEASNEEYGYHVEEREKKKKRKKDKKSKKVDTSKALPLAIKDLSFDVRSSTKVVVAIDFGTTFTGYAYSFIEAKDDIIMNPNWTNDGSNTVAYKTPTWVVLDQSNSLHTIGFEARKAYNLGTVNSEATLNLYKEFKLELMKKHTPEEEEVFILRSEYGQDVSALTVFCQVLKYLMEKILKGFTDAGKMICTDEICWVLTVPTLWTNNQKLFMKEAATKAGLIKSVDAKNIMIALEPEVAYLYCRNLKMNSFKGERGESTMKLKEGSVYMMLDAGGGTIDITVHKVLKQDKCAEIYQANGGTWGGSEINCQFEAKLKAILGNDFVTYCQTHNPNAWLGLMSQFEQVKQRNGIMPTSFEPLVLTLSASLKQCFRKFNGKSLTEVIEQNRETGIKIKRGRLEISPKFVHEMFQTVISKTINHIQYMMTNPEIAKVSVIFLVGGFGQCPYLQSEIKKHFEDRNRKVLIPTDGSLCTVKGAVLFGQQPDFMSTRIAKYTYAYEDRRAFNATTDSDQARIRLADEETDGMCLTTIIKKGEKMAYTEERNVEFDVFTEEFRLPIYCSESEAVDGPREDNMTQMAEVYINLRDELGESRLRYPEKVMVTFTLGTELNVKGKRVASDKAIYTTLRRKIKKSCISSLTPILSNDEQFCNIFDASIQDEQLPKSADAPVQDEQRPNIEEQYKKFKRAMEENVPGYVLSSMADKISDRIYVDIAKGKRCEAKRFFEEKMPHLEKFIKLTEQEPMAYIGGNTDTFSAGPEKKEKKAGYCAMDNIGMGNQLLPVKTENVEKICKEECSLEGVIKWHTGEVGMGSSAGFVKDQHGTIYKLTVRHPFYGKKVTEEHFEPTVGSEDEGLPIITEIKYQEDGKVIYIGDTSKSAFWPFPVGDSHKMADIALVKVREETLQHPALQRHVVSNKKIRTIKVFNGSDEEIEEGKRVEKLGPITQRTTGEVIIANQDVYINNIAAGGTFLVHSTGKSDKFAQKGDSGSLVLEKIGNKTEVEALGMCFKVGTKYTHPRTEVVFEDITRCVGLKHCIAFAEEKWDLKLEFCSQGEATPVCEASTSGYSSPPGLQPMAKSKEPFYENNEYETTKL